MKYVNFSIISLDILNIAMTFHADKSVDNFCKEPVEIFLLQFISVIYSFCFNLNDEEVY